MLKYAGLVYIIQYRMPQGTTFFVKASNLLGLTDALGDNFICRAQMKKPLIYGNLELDYHEERFFAYVPLFL